MSCHYCDVTALGCSDCDVNHHGLTTHGPLSHGLGSPVFSSKTVLHEFVQHVSATLLADKAPFVAKIEESLGKGTLSRFGRCRLSGAIQLFAQEISQKLGPEVLPALEKTLLKDEAEKNKRRKEAEEAARDRASAIAKEAAEIVAKEVARLIASDVAPKVAREAAVETATKEASMVAHSVAPAAAREAAQQPATLKATEIATQIANDIASRKMEELDTKQALDGFVQNQLPWLQNVQQETREAIRKAAQNAPAVTRSFGIPQDLAAQVPSLALYDFIIVCDNSGSMASGPDKPRIPTLRATVCGLLRIINDLGSDRPFSIVPFKGNISPNIKTENAVNKVLDSLSWTTGKNASVPLNATVLPELENAARQGKLHPTVVVVITDGDVGDVTDFGDRIGQLKTVLHKHNYTGPAVLFLICRVGNDQVAVQELKGLKKNRDIKEMILYSEEQLDSRLAAMQNDIYKYTGYVVGQLLKAMELQLIRR